jgi:hypothetical protein
MKSIILWSNVFKVSLYDTTVAENWWKEQADKNSLYQRFSNEDFHGMTEYVNIDDNTLKNMIMHTEKLINGSNNEVMAGQENMINNKKVMKVVKRNKMVERPGTKRKFVKVRRENVRRPGTKRKIARVKRSE